MTMRTRIGMGLLWVILVSPATAQDSLHEAEERAIKAAVGRVADSVVRIETFGGLERRVGQVLVGTGPTTGLIVSSEGHIVSSAFNFAQLPSSILVTLPDGQRKGAKIVARDHSRMLVFLKVDTDSPLPIPIAVPRKEMIVGQWAIAVGRTFQASQTNISVGVVSAVNRVWGRAVQTDAKISPSNYGGPLVDIRGRVMGVLVPLSPQSDRDVAGAEWYDSGIGFAVPLEDVYAHLEPLKQGVDLHRGLLGISPKGTDIYSEPAVVAAVQPKSPAYAAGIKTGDEIVEINGQKIRRQAQLQHALGPLYAGDQVEIVVMRGEGDERKRVPLTLELIDKLEPYEHPFIGVLPMRQDGPGVVVRYVYPGSPAAEAGIAAGERIVAAETKELAGVADLEVVLAGLEPGQSIELDIDSAGARRSVTVELEPLPSEVPTDLPPAQATLPPPEAPAAEVGIVDVKIPEFANECVAIVPDNYDPRIPASLVVWLHAPGGYDRDTLHELWKELCHRHQTILLAPKSSNPSRWMPTEIEFIEKTIADVRGRFEIDPKRIVIHGYQAGGALAYMVGFANREVIRAIAPVDAPMPRTVRLPANDPVQRLAIYSAWSDASRVAAQLKNSHKALRDQKYPVTEQSLEAARYLNADELDVLLRWIDTLDRL